MVAFVLDNFASSQSVREKLFTMVEAVVIKKKLNHEIIASAKHKRRSQRCFQEAYNISYKFMAARERMISQFIEERRNIMHPFTTLEEVFINSPSRIYCDHLQGSTHMMVWNMFSTMAGRINHVAIHENIWNKVKPIIKYNLDGRTKYTTMLSFTGREWNKLFMHNNSRSSRGVHRMESQNKGVALLEEKFDDLELTYQRSPLITAEVFKNGYEESPPIRYVALNLHIFPKVKQWSKWEYMILMLYNRGVDRFKIALIAMGLPVIPELLIDIIPEIMYTRQFIAVGDMGVEIYDMMNFVERKTASYMLPLMNDEHAYLTQHSREFIIHMGKIPHTT